MYCLSRPPKGLFHKILHWWLVLVTKACNNWPLLLEILPAKSQQQDVCKICRIDVICSANCQNWYGIGLQRNTHVDILRQSSLFFSSIHQFFDQSHHKNIKDRHNNDNRQPMHRIIPLTNIPRQRLWGCGMIWRLSCAWALFSYGQFFRFHTFCIQVSLIYHGPLSGPGFQIVHMIFLNSTDDSQA